MLNLYERVVILSDDESQGISVGDIGYICHIHNDGEAFEVEVSDGHGGTETVATVEAANLREWTQEAST